MKIVFQNIIVLLSFVAYNYFCLAKTSIKVGVFFNEGQSSETINWNVLRENIESEIDFEDPEVVTLPEADSFIVKKIFCGEISVNGYAAIFGPKEYISLETVESICSTFQIPYITTSWAPIKARKSETSESTFSMYPDANLLSQGLATIVRSLDWNRIVVIYEDEDSLAKLQDVLKIQNFQEGYKKDELILKHLGSGPDYRPLLKDVTSLSPWQIVLDCNVDKISEILSQAKEEKLLDVFSSSIFLTSLDAHTLDFTDVNKFTNITTIRLFDPNSDIVQKTTEQYYPTIPPEKLRVETALRHDAVLLLSNSLNTLLKTNPEFKIEPKFCNGTEEYTDSLELISEMQKTVITEGITGIFSLENGFREAFTLEVIEVNNPNKPIGIWSSENPDHIHLTRNATERERELQKRMQSYNFIVSSKLEKPYLMLSSDPDAVGNAKYRGFSKDLIEAIAKIMNITFQIELVNDNQTNTIVQALIKRKADLGICDFTITQERSELIDFSLPFMSLGISILHKETDQEEIDNMYGFMRPFSWTVWIYIITLYLLISIVLLLVARLDPDDWENPHPCNQYPEELENIWGIKNCLWLTLGSFMTQGCDILPKGTSSRIATAMWWFFSLIMTSSYTANLAAFLTMSKQDESIKSVEDLANQNKVKYGLVARGSTENFFKNSNNSLYQKMWATMKDEIPSVFEATNDDGVERILNTKQALYAFFMESPQMEYQLERNCKLKKIGQYLDSKSYGIGMPLGAEYRHKINAALLHLKEMGVVDQLRTKWWKIEDKEGEECTTTVEEDNDKLTLANVGGVFIVLATGIGMAFLFAILEFLWNVHNISIEEHMTYMEALKCEVKFACNLTVTKKAAKPVISESSSSSGSYDDSMARTVLAGAGSFLNINATVLNRLGQRQPDVTT